MDSDERQALALGHSDSEYTMYIVGSARPSQYASVNPGNSPRPSLCVNVSYTPAVTVTVIDNGKVWERGDDLAPTTWQVFKTRVSL